MDKLKDTTLIYGQNPVIDENAGEKIIRIGVCTRNMANAAGTYVPGCPPHPNHITDFLQGHGLDRA